MMYDDHHGTRSQIPAESLVLANHTDPRRDRLSEAVTHWGLFVLACCSFGRGGSSASAIFAPQESVFVRRSIECQREDSS